MVVMETTIEVVVPLWWDIKVTVAAAAFVIASWCWFAWSGGGGGDVDMEVAEMVERKLWRIPVILGMALMIKTRSIWSLHLNTLFFLS